MINPDNIQHVYPVNDLKPHITACIFPVDGFPYCECECQPSHSFEGLGDEVSGMVIIHNSFDGREHFEPDNKVRLN